MSAWACVGRLELSSLTGVRVIIVSCVVCRYCLLSFSFYLCRLRQMQPFACLFFDIFILQRRHRVQNDVGYGSRSQKCMLLIDF